MTVKKNQLIDIDVTGVAFGGRGIARVGGMAVFVDNAVPGDRVTARVFRKKKQYAEARAVDIIAASADRVHPPCPYSGYCGGCKWQFLDYEKQLQYKAQNVREALERIGGVTDVPVHPTIASSMRFGYRNKMEFSCTDRRWLLPEELGREEIDMGFGLGLHVPGTYSKVLDISACLLQPDAGNDILRHVRTFMRDSGLPAYGLRSHEGFWRFLMLRHSVLTDQWLVNVITAAEQPDVLASLADGLTARHEHIVSVVNNVTTRRAGVAIGEYEVRIAGEDHLIDRIGHIDCRISAGSFFQTNTRGAGALYDVVRSYAELTGTESVLDLYCGTGTIGLFLADRARRVTGVEIIESAVGDAVANAALNGIDNCRFELGDTSDVLGRIDHPVDVMVIDPPRAGMHKKTLKQVVDLNAPRIVYVSCNPATLSRDLAVLKDRYRICEVQPVDLFPHTFHIESVALLKRRPSGPAS